MYGDFQGQNQVMECINSSLLSIFLIDENQRITTKDIIYAIIFINYTS